ncbi:MAG: SpoIIE family protein phosphatase [Acidimicrobiales bacterium]
MTEPQPSPAFEWAIAQTPLPGETTIGDVAVVGRIDGTFLLATIDGLGHGEDAAAAAIVAAEIVRTHVIEPLDDLLTLCHQAMRSTRGAAITLARVETGAGLLSWVGVGNVEAFLLRNALQGPTVVDGPVLSGGIVGFDLPQLSVRTVELRRGDLVVLATDGIDYRFVEHLRFGMDVGGLAEHIVATYAKGTDDALVLVSRYRGHHE